MASIDWIAETSRQKGQQKSYQTYKKAYEYSLECDADVYIGR
jgi:hypothetical protein